MASIWIVLVLWIFVMIKVIQASSCATIHTPASVVLAGSPVSVSCSIEDDCPLTKGKNFHVAWKMNNHFVPSNLSYQESNRTYGVIIPSLPEPETFIACAVCEEENCLIVNGVQVKTGYPPSIPKNLSCSLNLTSSERLLCQWDPGQANLPTTYTLHISRVMSKKVTSKKYVIPPEAHFYLIPRETYSLLSEVEIHVTAANVLGNATSETLTLIPMETAIFDPPEINRIEEDVLGCLNYSWSLAKSQQWLTKDISLELRLKTVNNQQDKEMVLLFTKKQGSKINVCDLFHGTNYSATMRVKYSSLSKWSKWSDPKIATTVMKAPTGGLDTWLKVYDQNAELYWKPLENFRANGWNLLYTIESKKPKKTLCITQESHCSFSLTEKDEKIYLRVINAAGSSGHTEVPVYRNKGLGSVSNFSVHPQSETSVLIMWGGTPASLSVTGYVLEWRSLLEPSALSFTVMDKNISSTVLTELSPYKPYEMSLYPKYDKGIGSPYTLVAYSRQKAPELAPKLNVNFINSFVKLHWNEIPLEDRNGIIQGYTIYIWNDMKNIKVIKTEETSVVVKDLQPVTKYEALLTVHTMGGSLNGTVVPLVTGHIGGIEMVLFVIPACIGLSLLVIIIVFAYFGKHERVKMCLWPIIPDPANSSIKRWTTADSVQGMPSFKEDKEAVLVYLSHFSLLDLEEKEPFKSDYVKEDQWSHDIDSRVESHSSIQTGVRYDSEHDRDSVPYATVVFGGPYQNHSSCPPAYVRSESTQPLLGAEDPGSPPPYENVPPSGRASSKAQRFTTFPQNSTESEENEELWEEFPMLRSLEIRDTDHI